MKIIIAPDKFKGSLSSLQACKYIMAGVQLFDNSAMVLPYPMADGGDGFAEVLHHYLPSKTIRCQATDSLMRPVKTTYQRDNATKTAIIELAAASGLQHLTPGEKNPLCTTTYGTGLQIKDAIKKGAKSILLGLGGSATNDAGIGILAALGFEFADAAGKPLAPAGKNLFLINSIKKSAVLPHICFTIATDVQNILWGKTGAAKVYAAQKGADKKAINLLDKGLQHFAKIVYDCTGKNIATMPGTGAAGGVAAGLLAFFNCTITSGAQHVLNASKMEKELKNCNLLITGEGKLDGQSSYGKVVHEIAALGKLHQIPVIAICGQVAVNSTQVKKMGLQHAFSLTDNHISPEAAIKNTAQLLTSKTVEAMQHLMHAGI